MKNHMKFFSIYNISYKILIDSKPWRIRFDKIDGIISVYDEARFLTSFGLEEYEAINNIMRYLTKIEMSIKWHDIYFFLTILQKSKLILMILYL